MCQPWYLPALGGEVSTRPAAEQRAEHERLTGAVAALLGMDPSSPAVATRLTELATLFEGHVRAQDALFVTVAEAVPAAELTALGADLDAWSESSRCIAA